MNLRNCIYKLALMTVNTVCSQENDGHGHERQALKNVSR